MSDPRMRGRTVLAALSLLVLGAAAGVAVDRLVLLHRPHVVAVSFSRMQEQALAALDTVLDLRPQQREAVKAILDARQPAMDEVWRDTHFRLLAELEGTMTELESVLDAEQSEKLRALAAHLHGEPAVRPH